MVNDSSSNEAGEVWVKRAARRLFAKPSRDVPIEQSSRLHLKLRRLIPTALTSKPRLTLLLLRAATDDTTQRLDELRGG
jgi:hypothetical protein